MSLSLLNHMSTFISDMDEDGRKELVEAWMNDDLVKRQFNLECPSDEETPIVSVEEKIEVVEKKEKKKTPAKEKSQEAAGKKKFDPVKFLKENPDTPIKCIPDNPKKAGTASYDFYEGYKNATTLQEFMDSGGENKHLRYDFSKGFIHILDDSVENVASEEKIKTSPKKKKSNPKKKKEKKKEVSKVEKKEEKNEEKNEEKMEETNEEVVEEEITFKPLSDITTDEDIEEDDDEWPTRTIDGVEYFFNDSDQILIDKETAEQIGYLDDDGTIDFTGNGEDVHEKNKENL